MQQIQKITPEMINRTLTGMKRELSRVEGEITTMRGDVQANVFQGIVGMFNQLHNDNLELEKQVKEQSDTLDKIYQGHPDIKIRMEAEKKEKIDSTAKPKKK
jgi:hypothetical protein